MWPYPQNSVKKVILKISQNLQEKQLFQSLVFNKVADLACNFIKKETLAQVFSCEFCEIFKNTFSYRTPLVAASVSWLGNFAIRKNSTLFVHERLNNLFPRVFLYTFNERSFARKKIEKIKGWSFAIFVEMLKKKLTFYRGKNNLPK